MLEGAGGDVRQALRTLRKSPGFTGVAVLSLALGIGANTAMLGVVRTLLLSPLPVDAPQELALVAWNREGSLDISQMGSTSYADPETGASLRSNFSSPLVDALEAATPDGVELVSWAFLRDVTLGTGEAPPVLAGGALVSGDWFDGLRVPLAVGRGLTPEDDRPGAPLVAVLGYDFWSRTFGSDPSVVGRTLRVNGQLAEVVGVTARGFVGLSMGGFFGQSAVTLPLAAQPEVVPSLWDDGTPVTEAPNAFWLRLMARVPDGMDRGRVEAAFADAFARTPSPVLEGGEGPFLVRLVDGSRGAQPIRGETSRLLYFLLGVVGLVLLIACVNLASLMFGRGVARQREMAVRRALGGPRARLVRQHATEAGLLALAGTGAGLLLAFGSRNLLAELLASSVGAGAYRVGELSVRLDPVVLAVAVGAGLATTLVFGLLPALRFSGLDPADWLKQRTAGATGVPRLTVGRLLIALQIAVSVPLVVGSVLFLRTVANLGAVELGFDPAGLVSFQVNPAFTGRPEAEHARLYQEALAGVAEVPGVRAVSLIQHPLMGGITSNGGVEVGGERRMMYFNSVGPAFLETLGVELLAGRMPGVQDGPDAPRVAVVNQTAVREIFGGASPVGQIVRRGDREVQIVGVVGDTPYRNLRDPVPPVLHESALQTPGFNGHHVLARFDGPPARVEEGIREALRRVDPDLPVPEFRNQTELMAASSARERVFTRLLTLFGGFALLLAAIGLHGVTAYAVARRTAEFGVRVAVGARPGQIVALVLRQVLVLSALGLALGVPLALMASPVVASLLYGVAPTDPGTVALAGLALLAVAVGAGLLPAVRAGRIDALRALSSE